MLKFYEYDKCSTCRNARKWLDAQGVAYERLPIRDTPPSPAELQTMLDAYDGDIKKVLNTSSADYRTSGIKDELPNLSPSDVFARLQDTGNLVKRPFLIGDGVTIVGFKEAEWAAQVS
ncbi:Spx/MgsR family RNA polymerase-binding regulatory protein [Cerasicoccus maritimus]|uniref:Spx/MgsR family RNA polymerase-binding regulatory protein n=1 Tax=Cerasicoccus maritimus TaxID=490089 RepID=UPI0028526923|nr:Spx/MgsR family RNA polymerase-binding regulatory protein [Cerasicoccus maritimus]